MATAVNQHKTLRMWGNAHPLKRVARYAIGYEEKPVEPPQFYLPRFEETLRDVFSNKIIPFFLWIIKAFFVIAALSVLSMGTYAILYWGVIVRGLEVQSHSIFFDYSPGESLMPVGRVDLRSSRSAPWVYIETTATPVDYFPVGDQDTTDNKQSCINKENLGCEEKTTNTNEITNTEEGQTEKMGTPSSQVSDENTILIPGQRYFFEVTLTLPESEINKQLGVFMLTVNLQSSDGLLLATSKQSSMLPYESKIVGVFRKLSLLLPLASGLLSETRTIDLLCFDNYVDANDEKSISTVEVRLGIPNPAVFPATLQTIQIQSAELRYGKEMTPVQLFFRNWRYLCAFCGVTVFFLGYSFLALLFFHSRAKKRWTSNLSQQPYGDFFDSIDGSNHNSKSGSWMGADIEFLDDDENDWEPIDSNDEFKNGANKNIRRDEKNNNDTSNVISDEESITSNTDAAAISKEINETSHSKKVNFPLGSIANIPSVQEHEPMFSSLNKSKKIKETKQSADNEEKCLADMVMKGYSKWEI